MQLSSEEILMQINRELVEFDEHLTDAEIIYAIRYLDPDSYAEQAGEGAIAVAGIEMFLSALTNALSCICLYMRSLSSATCQRTASDFSADEAGAPFHAGTPQS
jgi:hypothetical protein